MDSSNEDQAKTTWVGEKKKDGNLEGWRGIVIYFVVFLLGGLELSIYLFHQIQILSANRILDLKSVNIQLLNSSLALELKLKLWKLW